MQNQGSLGPNTVADLLQTMHQERATGTLSLSSNGSQCSLHFLFGHLFHAVGGGQEGEAAVLDAIGWSQGEYSFNPRAKLPPEETINSSTEKLLEEWRSRSQMAAAPVRTGQSAGSREEPEAPAGFGTASRTPVTSATSSAELANDEEDWMPPGSVSGAAASEPEEIPSFPPANRPPVESRPAEVPPVRSAPANGARTPERSTPAPVPAPASTPAPPARRPVANPYPPVAASAPRPAAGGSRAQLSVLVPMPAGVAVHSGLKASFLNFPMFLKTLGQDGFSGYTSIRGEGDPRSIGHILFREGAVVQAQLRSAGSYRRGKAALQEVVRAVGQGEGLIDAIEIPAELVAGVASLVTAATLFVNLPSRIVDFEALVQYIEDQRTTGGILVTVADQVSVALLDQGEVKGSYSSSLPEMAPGAEAASSAAQEREGRIDVVSSPAEALPALDVAEAG